nr:translesion error-prone DNA polymerase V autoproteolytic subunit [uncultured Comamonas sp.]
MYSKLDTPGNALPVQSGALSVLMAASSVRAGFPSPAEDHAVSRLNVADLLVQHEQATFMMRVGGPSMRDCGIEDRDLVLVDRAVRARHGHIVVAILDGELTIKKLYSAHGVMKLQAGNAMFPDIHPREGESLEIFGVVTWCLKRLGP